MLQGPRQPVVLPAQAIRPAERPAALADRRGGGGEAGPAAARYRRAGSRSRAAERETVTEAPGRPGIPPRWTSSAKSGVGTALSDTSRVWFTISHGILNEVYYPRVDQACIRDLGLIVTDGASFFAEEKRDCEWSSSRSRTASPPSC